MSYTK